MMCRHTPQLTSQAPPITKIEGDTCYGHLINQMIYLKWKRPYKRNCISYYLIPKAMHLFSFFRNSDEETPLRLIIQSIAQLLVTLFLSTAMINAIR